MEPGLFVMVNITINGLDEFRAKYGEDKVRRMMRDATTRAVDFVHGHIPQDPKASGKPYPFVSQKQFRYVMMLIRQGLVPYRRTHQLRRSITTEVRPIGADVVGIIGTNLEYAPWVISSERVGSRGPQALYHQGTWWTLQEEVKKRFGDVVDIYRNALRGFIGG